MPTSDDQVWTLSPRDLQRSTETKLLSSLAELFEDVSSTTTKTKTGTKYRVRVKNLRLARPLDENDYTAERKSRMGSKTYGVPILADVVVERNGKEIDSHRGKRLGTLPTMTDRFSYLVAGKGKPTSEIQITNLMRRRHGLYTKVDKSGKAFTEVVTEPHGISDPEDYRGHITFQLKVGKDGQVLFSPKGKTVKGAPSIPLYAVLSSLGMSERQIEKRLGKKNATEQRGHWERRVQRAGKSESEVQDSLLNAVYEKVYEKARAHPESDRGKRKRLLAGIKGMVLDPVTSDTLLGKPYERLEPDALATSAKNLLDVVKGSREPDDQISLAFQKVSGPDDLLADFFLRSETRRAVRGKVKQKLYRLAENDVKLRKEGKKARFGRDVLSGVISDRLNDFYLRSDKNDLIAQPGMNPVSMLGEATKLTPMSGKMGGIGESNAVKFDQKLVSPSHLTFVDPVHTPEGERAGVTLHMAIGTKREKRHGVGVITSDVWAIKDGKLRSVTPADVQNSTVAFPDQFTWSNGKPVPVGDMVTVQRGDQVLRVKPHEVDYVIPRSHQIFSAVANLVPFFESNQGNRGMMAVKQIPQAVSLVDREAPPIQVRRPGSDTSFEEAFGKGFAAITAPVSGKVTEVHDDADANEAWVKIKPLLGRERKVPLYRHYPLREHGQMHSDPKVKVGDKVKLGDLIADSGYTKDGTLALGKTLLTAYMPWYGYSTDDGVVLSESGAKKLSSKHLYEEVIEVQPGEHTADPAFFSSLFKAKLDRSRIKEYTKDGVPNKGVVLNPGDPISTVVGRRREDVPGLKGRDRTNRATYWKGSTPAKVVDVVKEVTRLSNNEKMYRYRVLLETVEPAEVGDKIVSRAANKGIVAKIVPDAEMPRTKDGKVIDFLMNPAGVPSRMNVGQVLETALGKVVDKERETNPEYEEKVESFSGRDNVEWVKKRLEDAGLSDQEELINPKNGRPYGGDGNTVMVGQQYVMKLKHQIDKKVTARNAGKVNPGTGIPTGEAQRIGLLNFFPLIAHGARANLYEMMNIKSGGPRDPNDVYGLSEFNQSVHDAIIDGSPIPRPTTKHPVWDEFESNLRTMGVRIDDDGEKLQVLPMTDDQLSRVSGGEISTRVGSPTHFKKSGLIEVKGGLYDPKITGGRDGDKWSHFSLPGRYPKPVYAQSIGLLLGLDANDRYSDKASLAIADILAGKEELNGKTGKEAIIDGLASIDVKKELKATEALVNDKSLTKKERSLAVKKIRVLRLLKETGMDPVEAYTTSKLPIVPPRFRPLREMDGLAKNPLNRLYAEVAGKLESQKELRKGLINTPGYTRKDVNASPDIQHGDASIYDALRSLDGLVSGGQTYWKAGGYIKPGDKGVVPRLIGGKESKSSFFQDKLLSRRQDFTARSVIIPNPTLGLDQVGVPEAIAWDLYQPYIIKRLIRSGAAKKASDALRMVEGRVPAAEAQLRKEMADRPVLVKRDPTLHKYGIMAFEPVLLSSTPGEKEKKAIEIHPMVAAPFNADFDGDEMALFLPVTEDARKEAQSMFPSRNIFGPATGLPMFVPSQEALLGLNMLTQPGKTTKHKFKTTSDAIDSYKKGDLRMDDVIHVDGKKTMAGRLIIDESLPEKYRQFGKVPFDKQRVFTKKELSTFLVDVGKNDTENFALVADKLKGLGFKYVTEGGFSISLSDLEVLDRKVRDRVFDAAQKRGDKIWASDASDAEKGRKIVALYSRVDGQLELKNGTHNAKSLQEDNNRLFRMVRSGSKGNPDQVQQMVVAPILVMNAKGEKVPVPITKSYGEGLDIASYFVATHGARKGLLQKVLGVRDPGKVSKQVLRATMDFVVAEKDCGTKKGIDLSLSPNGSTSGADLRGRYLASTGAFLTEGKISALRQKGVKTVKVRSALTCEANNGICQKCTGLNENGEDSSIGTNVGVISGQSIGEPLTQLSMRVFHGGGLAKGQTAGSQDMFATMEGYLNLPSISRIPHQTAVAPISGTITSVKQQPTGGWKVLIKDKDGKRGTAMVHKGKDRSEDPKLEDLMVDRTPLSVGTKVLAGDRLTSTGVIHPRELLNATGDLPRVQELMVDEIHSLLRRGANDKLLRKHTEVVVRALTDRWEVTDSGDHPTLLPGDVVRSGHIKDEMAASGNTMKLAPRVMKSSQVPLTSDDWQVRLHATNLKSGILDSANYGLKSITSSLHPIPAYGFSLSFGQGPGKDPAKY